MFSSLGKANLSNSCFSQREVLIWNLCRVISLCQAKHVISFSPSPCNNYQRKKCNQRYNDLEYILYMVHFFTCIIESTLCGPVHTEKAVEMFRTTLDDVKNSGGKIHAGGKVNKICISIIFHALRLIKASSSIVKKHRGILSRNYFFHMVVVIPSDGLTLRK